MHDYVPNVNYPPVSAQRATQPPDLTSNTNTTSRADRVNRYNQQHAHAQSVRVTQAGAMTGMETEGGGRYTAAIHTSPAKHKKLVVESGLRSL